MATGSEYETLYISNLPDKKSLEKIKYELLRQFRQYGNIIDIIAHKNIRMRGQAFIIYENKQSARLAVEFTKDNPVEMFERQIKVDFARNPSDIIVKTRCSESEFETFVNERKTRDDEAWKKKFEQIHNKSNAIRNSIGKPSKAFIEPNLPPHRILFIQNLPEDTTAAVLKAIYSRYTGYIESRVPPGRKGIAFIEFETDEEASIARSATFGMQLGEHAVSVNFGRRL